MTKKSNTAPLGRCHEKHPELKIGGGVFVGAACGSPRPGFNIYVGLDWGMTLVDPKWPWAKPVEGAPEHELQYEITDHSVPKTPKVFREMVMWLCSQLELGKRIHVGCIGGHGRTGLLLAAVVAELKMTDDPIKWVRENHCEKAVESISQVEYLVKHHGAKTAKPRSYGTTKTTGGAMTTDYGYYKKGDVIGQSDWLPSSSPVSSYRKPVKSGDETFFKVKSKSCVWGV